MSAHHDHPSSTLPEFGAARPPADVGGRTVEWVRAWQGASSTEALLGRVLEHATGLVDGAEHASVALVREDRVVLEASTSPAAEEYDTAQIALHEGPCWDAVRTRAAVLVDDLRADDRWPALSRSRGAAGIRSAACLPLFVDGAALGRLSLLSTATAAFTPADLVLAEVFAAHAAVAVLDSRATGHLTSALHNRDVIGQAKGILMERLRITPDQAFELLVRASQDRNLKLHRVAEELASTGSLGT